MTDPIRYVLAFMLPLIGTWLVVPSVARLAIRVGMVDHPKKDRFHTDPTPYLGGLAVAAGLALIGTVAASAQRELLVIVACGFALGAVGFVDDWRSIDPRVKLGLEAAAGAALWLVGVRAGFFGIAGLDLALTIGWIVVITNAVNLLDNMDGLCSGVIAISATTFFAIAAQRGDYLVGSFALAVAGGSLGFLRHNYPPAKIFLGDAGSLMLGFFLGSLALKLDLIGPSGPVRAGIVLLIVGVPLFDTLLVIIARLREGRIVYQGSTDHSSHRLATLGLSSSGVAVAMYVVQIGLCGVALLLAHAPTEVTAVTLIALVLLTAALMLVFLRMPHPMPAADAEATLVILSDSPESRSTRISP